MQNDERFASIARAGHSKHEPASLARNLRTMRIVQDRNLAGGKFNE
jgi:hypothetical protein